MLISRLGVLALLTLLAMVEQVDAAGTSPTFTTTNNWSGYAATGGNLSVTNVAGSWRVPKSQCNGTTQSDTAIFVGIDGYPPGGPTVEQVGTAAECKGSGAATYVAFYEFVCAGCPAPQTYTVHAGDVISAVVTCSSGTDFTVTLMDGATTLISAQQPPGFSAACSSAEWVVEDPFNMATNSLFPLTTFGQINFTQGSATIAGQTGPIGSFTNSTAIMMTSDGTPTGVVEVVPSKLSGGGLSFVASTQAQSFEMYITCTSSGQTCVPDYLAPLTFTHSGALTITITALKSHCSNVRFVISLDGAAVASTPFLVPGGNSGPFRTTSVSAGAHTVAVQATGEVGGCNTGTLGSWGGTLVVAQQ